jgi:hypothetical protein
MSNGASSYVGAAQTQLFGTYQLLQAKSSADGAWAWVTLSTGILTLIVYPPPPPTVTVSPGTLFLSTGDTNRTITTTISPTATFTPTFSQALNSNPNSNCNASLSFSNNGGTGSVNTTVTAGAAGCSGIFNVTASANGVPSSNATAVVVPPQILIKLMVGEAGGQVTGGDTSQPAIAASARNRLGDPDFNSGATTYQGQITTDQYFGASNTTANGQEPELDNSVGIFTGLIGDIVSGSKCYWSPTAAQWTIVQQALNTNATTFPANTGAPGCWVGQGRQIVNKTSIGVNNRGGDYAGAPAFLFLRLSSVTSAVVQIP